MTNHAFVSFFLNGAFKGCGVVEITDTSAVNAAAKKNDLACMGRDIRIDYAESKKERRGGGEDKFRI